MEIWVHVVLVGVLIDELTAREKKRTKMLRILQVTLSKYSELETPLSTPSPLGFFKIIKRKYDSYKLFKSHNQFYIPMLMQCMSSKNISYTIT